MGEFEDWKAEYVRQIDHANINLAAKDSVIKDMQFAEASLKGHINTFKEQIAAHESTLHAKNNTIHDLERENKSLGG